MTGSQVELVEAARVNNRVAADTRTSLFQFTQKREVGIEKECFAVGVVDVLSLDEKGTAGQIRLLNAHKLQTGLK